MKYDALNISGQHFRSDCFVKGVKQSGAVPSGAAAAGTLCLVQVPAIQGCLYIGKGLEKSHEND